MLIEYTFILIHVKPQSQLSGIFFWLAMVGVHTGMQGIISRLLGIPGCQTDSSMVDGSQPEVGP